MVNEKVVSEYRKLVQDIAENRVDLAVERLDLLKEVPDLCRSVLTCTGEEHIPHYLGHLAVEAASETGNGRIITAILQAAREVGILDEVIHQDHWNCYWGDTLSTAVWLDSCKGTAAATHGIMNAIKDDRTLVRRYFVRPNGKRTYNDCFLHMANREYGLAVLTYGVEQLRRQGLLEEAYEQRNENDNTPLHVAAYRGSREQADIMLRAIADTPSLMVRCLTAQNAVGRSPCDYNGESINDDPGLRTYLQQTQRFLKLKLAEAQARMAGFSAEEAHHQAEERYTASMH